MMTTKQNEAFGITSIYVKDIEMIKEMKKSILKY